MVCGNREVSRAISTSRFWASLEDEASLQREAARCMGVLNLSGWYSVARKAALKLSNTLVRSASELSKVLLFSANVRFNI